MMLRNPVKLSSMGYRQDLLNAFLDLEKTKTDAITVNDELRSSVGTL